MTSREHPLLRKAPLKSVVCQLRFPRILGLSDDNVRPFQVALSDEYPDVEADDAQQLQIGPEGIRAGEAERVYRFRTHAGDWIVALSQGSLSLETTKYTVFKHFLERWQTVARLAADKFEIRHQERLGFRFINELPLPGPEIDGLRAVVRPELIGIIGSHERTHAVIRSLQELRFQQDDGACTIRHGYVPKSETTSVYLLDFDYYDDSGKEFDLENQKNNLIGYNHAMFDLFKYLVTAEAFKSYEPAEREQQNA